MLTVHEEKRLADIEGELACNIPRDNRPGGQVQYTWYTVKFLWDIISDHIDTVRRLEVAVTAAYRQLKAHHLDPYPQVQDARRILAEVENPAAIEKQKAESETLITRIKLEAFEAGVRYGRGIWAAQREVCEPIQIWACGENEHRHLSREEAARCILDRPGQ